MRKLFAVLGVLCLVLTSSATAFASTNGTNLIGIGPIARSMGGVGIAAPQDAISAVFANPAAMCFGAYCPGSEFNFAGTLFRPKPEAKVSAGGVTASAKSDEKIYNIPAIGLSVPIPVAPEIWRFGLAAYGVSGLGVDYRDTKLDQPVPAFGGNPLVAGSYTQLQTMKFAPAVAYQPTDRLSLGLDLQVDYSSLDLGSGSTFNYGWGYQLGVLYRLTDAISLGATYISPQKVKYENVLSTGNLSQNLELESPQQVGFGVAFTLFDKLLIEGDVRWLNWSDAQGYHEFDWDDQWVYAIGAEWAINAVHTVRCGFNYGNNPVPDDKLNPLFPAIPTTHLTLGYGANVGKWSLDLAYEHAFEEEQKSTNPAMPIEIAHSQNTVSVGATYRY
jgi:long-chain fatty acid transport protein